MGSLLYVLLASPALVSVVSGKARHALTSLGAVLIAKNYLGADQMNLAIGAVMTLIGIVWSVGTKALPDLPVDPAPAK